MKRVAKPFTVEIKRSRRSRAPASRGLQPEADTLIGDMMSERAPDTAEPEQQGRVLPVLDAHDAASHGPVPKPRPAVARRPKRNKVDVTPDLADDADTDHKAGAASEPDRLALGMKIEDRISPQVPQTDKLPREAFRRSERWKHRLPAAVQRSVRRKEKT